MIDFIIIGAQKAATSALQASLRKHPLVHMPKGESPFFEDPDYQSAPWEAFINKAPPGCKLGIKRPDYLCSLEAMRRIKAHNPKCKFIVVLREPVSRTISSYCYMVRHAHLPALPLNQGIQSCIDAYNKNQDNRASSVISYGLYGAYLKQWFDEFGRDQFLILSQQEVNKHLPSVLRQCLAHVDVPESQISNVEIVSEESNVGLYDPDMLKVARVASLIKTKPVPNSPRRIPRALPLRLLGVALSRYAEWRASTKGQRRESLNDDIACQLNTIFNEDAKMLNHLLGHSTFGWKQ